MTRTCNASHIYIRVVQFYVTCNISNVFVISCEPYSFLVAVKLILIFCILRIFIIYFLVEVLKNKLAFNVLPLYINFKLILNFNP